VHGNSLKVSKEDSMEVMLERSYGTSKAGSPMTPGKRETLTGFPSKKNARDALGAIYIVHQRRKGYLRHGIGKRLKVSK